MDRLDRIFSYCKILMTQYSPSKRPREFSSRIAYKTSFVIFCLFSGKHSLLLVARGKGYKLIVLVTRKYLPER